MPGRDWYLSFIGRHKKVLSPRFCQNITRARAGVSREVLEKYFANLQISLHGVKPNMIVNYDETNMTYDPQRAKVVVRRGAKYPERVMDHSKVSVSVMFSGTASGIVLPPMIVYKSEHLYDTWMENGPKGSIYGCSKSGWFDGHLFQKWFCNIALPYFRSCDKGDGNSPKVLIGDNLTSHLSMPVIEECRKHNIKFVLLPPNSTHICQPLDVDFFRPLKIKWRQTLAEFKAKYKGTIPKNLFPRYLNATLEKLENASQNLCSGFRATGLYPFNPQQVLNKRPAENEVSSANSTADGSWSEAFIGVLREARFGQSSAPRVRKRRVVNVDPGLSVNGSLEDTSIDQDPSSTSAPSTTASSTSAPTTSAPTTSAPTTSAPTTSTPYAKARTWSKFSSESVDFEMTDVHQNAESEHETANFCLINS
ncbi:jerky protein homolog-like [Bacillus rossius redtenbacheri]|uniref:jerky protein homolog-like n=1 Tax=Bacillus rossius redtenbacheri TaxID=93214 RepID=UPI002FDEC139